MATANDQSWPEAAVYLRMNSAFQQSAVPSEADVNSGKSEILDRVSGNPLIAAIVLVNSDPAPVDPKATFAL